MATKPPSGYGKLTNPIRLEKVYMVTHNEGEGTEESPQHQVRTFFSKDGDFLGRIDPIQSYRV